MKLLIDIGHPAHVHLFKNFAWQMEKRGHDILFTCREKEFEIELLREYGFNYKSFGKKYKSRFGKVWGMIEFDVKEFIAGFKFKPDLFLSHGSMYAAHASTLLRKPHISLEDTFNFEQVRLYLPFTNVVLTGNYDHPSLGKKEVKYNGYHELAYLHPNYYTPDKNILNELAVKDNEKYVIIRFVSWQATHDKGHKGISFENKIKAINEFEKYAKVFISSEAELPNELEKYKINILPHKMHDALSYASLVWAESFTVPAECSMSGTPSIINHSTKSFYLYELENKYELCYNYNESEEDQFKAIEKGIELLNTPHLNKEWQKRRERMLTDKIDVTTFLVWFVEDYPDSAKVMKENPDFQYNFK